MKKTPEIQMISKILEIEPKDVPYLVLAFKHKVPIITTDERSLAKKSEKIRKLTRVEISTVKGLL
nr:hypothetical protein [Candidatus Baldrarchaeota archaeon]